MVPAALLFLYYTVEAVHLVGTADADVSALQKLIKTYKIQRVTRQKEFCPLSLVCATRATSATEQTLSKSAIIPGGSWCRTNIYPGDLMMETRARLAAFLLIQDEHSHLESTEASCFISCVYTEEGAKEWFLPSRSGQTHFLSAFFFSPNASNKKVKNHSMLDAAINNWKMW